MVTRPEDLKARAWEADLIDWRGFRIQQMQNWKHRIKVVDKLYRGEWAEIFTNESVMTENPHVMNMVQTGMEDITKLVTEAVPGVVFPPLTDSQSAARDAHIREAIAKTHWSVNRGDVLVPRFAMDLAGAGVAFCAAYADRYSGYPCYHRIDPRFAYPDVANGMLQDLMVLEDLNVRTAARLFPDLGLERDPALLNHVVELMHYYSAEGCLQAVMTKETPSSKPDRMYVTRRWSPRDVKNEPYLPVAFAQLDSYDGAFRGMFDQIMGSLLTKNRIVKQVLDYSDQFIYAPMEEAGVLNPEAVPGPGTVYHLDPTVQGAGIRRVAPAASAPEVFNLLEYLDREQRGGVSYPSARQGEVSQSQASASFVASTQGALTSTVRNVQRLIASLREQLNEISFKIDESELNTKKDLLYSVGAKNSYTPKTDIAGQYRNSIVYGAGAGLDRMQADIRVMQHRGNGLVSAQTAREQIDYIADGEAEEERIEYETTRGAVMQKLLQMEDPSMLFDVMTYQEEGKSFAQAVALAKARAEATAASQQAAAGAAPGGMPVPPGAGAALENQGMQAGATAPAGAGGAEIAFAPPPSENVTVQNPMPTRTVNLGR